MKKIPLIGSTLFVFSALFLPGCDEQLQQGQAARENHDLESSENLDRKQQNKVKELVKVVAPNVNKPIEPISNAVFESDILEVEDDALEEPVALDFSLHLDIQEINNLSYTQGAKQRLVLPGIFDFENMSVTNVEMEAHFAGPHNENKEKETTPDGAGVKFKIDF